MIKIYAEDWRDQNDFSLNALCENMMDELLIAPNCNENRDLKHITYNEIIKRVKSIRIR